ncbi:WD repeat and HMG-box DNA-binding protein 1 [Cyphomyrmex costatus]|uniref:WD repeat and HMG-box DNA-binding protein 1 n=1 Tax=Cyphomyrmex costatus TaxID=456900 RepID=A0A195C6E8_9HYME|nr:WD repeat and HMG-box DNA-binding protein 1 [Cyphomyrmex costatus]
MSLIRKPMRYAHQEGHTDVCYYSGEKRGLVTCGRDGDVRFWLNLMDDDPTTSCISEQAITAISKNGKIFVGNDNNTVQILTYPDLEKEGIVTRFSAPVSALATTKNSSLIISGACDMRIQVTNINTSDSIELEGHEAPILGLSLDPKEEFVASSSADGSIRVWNIKEKQTVHIWNNIVPKCNSFFIAKSYCTPSFKCTDGSCLAYPSNKDDISICKFSECGTRIAASSLYGEIVVWNVETKEMIGYLEHEQDAKITALVWHIDHSNEIAFCDALGKLGCIDVLLYLECLQQSFQISVSKPRSEVILDFEQNEDVMENDILSDNDDDDENVISLNKIKASINLKNDEKSNFDVDFEKPSCDTKTFIPNVKLQSSFQPGSTPSHLLSYFMMWNDVGMIRCFSSEDGEECSIEVEFHDVTVHRSMHINNYLRHSLAALSTQALVLSCPASEDGPSWGSGNKEWSLDLPEGEESECLAVGDNFVAVATSRRNLRIFMIGGTQREILALPGPVVVMNGLGNHLVIAYHAGVGPAGDQNISLLWIQIQGAHLRSQTLTLPLSPTSDLMWLGLSDARSPTIMDSDDVIRIYDKKSCQWRVLCDANAQGKGRADHYFIIGVSEYERNMRCILCKGSYYPPTTPRPIITEVSLSAPLCEPESEKTEKERKLWEIGNNPLDETEAILTLIALACKSNLEYRAVDICEQIASTKVIDLAVRYALRLNKMALANKLETIADAKSDSKNTREEEMENHQDDFTSNNSNNQDNNQEDNDVSLPSIKKPEIEIKPLVMSQTLKRVNPFLKAGSPSLSPRGLAGLNSLPKKPQKPVLPNITPVKSKSKTESKKESFINWYSKNKKNLQEEFPEVNVTELTKIGLARYKEVSSQSNTDNVIESSELVKKRKLSNHVPLDPIQEAMGSMGLWHIVIAVAISLVKFPVAWHQLSIVFLAPPTNFSCIAPLSATNDSMIMKCEVNVGNDTIEECTKFAYDKRIFRESIITQWNLVCDREQLANLAQSCTMFGVLVGNLIFSMMADRIGRKKPLMIAIALQSVTGFASAFAPWYELFLILKFVCAVSTGGTMLVSFVLLMEIIGVKWRSIMSVLYHVPFLIGHVMNPLISYLTLTWYGFQMAVSIPSIFLLSYYWIIPESPRWLLVVGKHKRAERILLKAARRNKIPVENVKLALETYENQRTIRHTKNNEKYNITHLFRTPNLRLKTTYVSVNWFVCGICFFGLAQYMGHLDGNIFINVAVSAAMEIPGTIIVLFLISRVSRLKILMGGNILSGVSLLLITLVTNGNVRIFLASLGLVGMAISFPTVYLYSCEVFPTVVRNVGVGLGSTSARIGSIIAPFIATMGTIKPWLPPVIFGIAPILGAILCLFLPETMNCELPETIEDAENFRKYENILQNIPITL